MTLILRFTIKEYVFDEYTTIDLNRQSDWVHINITNSNQNFAFNNVFERITEYLGDDNVAAGA